MSVFHPPLILPDCTVEQRAELLNKMRVALAAESNYYGALYRAGGMTIAQRDEYDDSRDAAHRAIGAAYGR